MRLALGALTKLRGQPSEMVRHILNEGGYGPGALGSRGIEEGELHTITAFAESMRDNHSRGFEFLVRGDSLHIEEGRGDLIHLKVRAEEVVTLYRKDPQ